MNPFKGNGDHNRMNLFIYLSIFIHLHKFILHLTSYVGEEVKHSTVKYGREVKLK